MRALATVVLLGAACAGVLAMGIDSTEQALPLGIPTEGGVVRGVLDQTYGVISWKGVPYAQTTGGAHRFMPPVPLSKPTWQGVRDASNWGPGCPQYKVNADAPAHQDEDCLHVNVYAPASATPNSKLPVMVFIHGGGFLEGSNIGPYQVYDGRYVASHGVVMVAINYRLGVLGFYVGTGVNGNMGFLDQQMALGWVRRNIANFGGDPNALTLWGESAGAMSIGLHMVSPGSRGLFHKVIQESNPLAILYKTPQAATILSQEFCSQVKCSSCNMACLQALPIATLLAGAKAAAANTWTTVEANWRHVLGALLDYVPVIDGHVIPQQVIPALRSGAYDKTLPVLIGSNSQEGVTFVYEAFTKAFGTADTKIGLALIFPFEAVQLLGKYTLSTDTDGRQSASRVATDFLFTCPAQQFAIAAKKNGQAAYVYQYQHVFSDASLFTGLIPDQCATSVCHATELPIVFGNAAVKPNGVPSSLTATEKALASTIVAYWTNFAKTGNPNAQGLPVWEQFNPATRSAFILGGATAGTYTASYADTCSMWDGIGYGTGSLRFRAVANSATYGQHEIEHNAGEEILAAAEAQADADAETETETEEDAEADAEEEEHVHIVNEAEAEIVEADVVDHEHEQESEEEEHEHEHHDAEMVPAELHF